MALENHGPRQMAQAYPSMCGFAVRVTRELSGVASWAHDLEAQSLREPPWFGVVAE